jgi:hypothetical protein
VQIANYCGSWEISNGVKNLVFVSAAILRGRCLPLIPKRWAYPALSEDYVKDAGKTFADGVEVTEIKIQLLLRGDNKTANETLRQALELLAIFLTARFRKVEEFSLLGYNTMQSVECKPTFRSIISPSSSGPS